MLRGRLLTSPAWACPQEFKASDDVSLYIHTVTYPDLSYRRDLILAGIQDYLNSVNISNTLLMGDERLPHIHVMGELLLPAAGWWHMLKGPRPSSRCCTALSAAEYHHCTVHVCYHENPTVQPSHQITGAKRHAQCIHRCMI
jgi:hypothetical protein